MYLAAGQYDEGVGSRRKVFAKFSETRRGWYEEIRTDQIEGRKVTFLVYRDSFGTGRILKDVGATMELVPEGSDRTRFTFTFYHRPKNVIGWLLNALIRMDQRKHRLRALQSIKRYAEGGAAIKN